jgi:DNA-binding MarR family transcriptional regulator
MSKALVSLLSRHIISQTGNNTKHDQYANKIKLLMPELSKEKPKFKNPEFDNPIYNLNPSSFKVLTFIKEIGRVSGVDFIAEKTKLNKRTVSMAMMELEEKGLIRKIQNSKQKMIEAVDA